jgi:succinate dehydrogenase / fumarate reductase flavoprotein subunit
MLHTLYQRNVAARTQFFVEWMALDLLRNEAGDVLGVTALEMETGEIYVLEAKQTVLATGGAGRIWAASTNAFINTGDGLGMAARAGLPLQDLEFWQFHPTGVAGAGVLITEGVRGEGGILLNKDGERFMERYAPTLKDLAPRDFVSRSMDQEIKEGRGCGDGSYVVLKLDHLGADTIKKRLPSIREIAIKFANVDPIKDPIPVVPTIHYQMGGIPTNVYGQVVTTRNGENTTVNGLYAIGECAATSVHGANRLGTNSLLDLIVFGRSSGNHIVESHPERQRAHQPIPESAIDYSLDRVNQLESRSSGESVADVGNAMRVSMQHHCGVFRTLDLLNKGVDSIESLVPQVENMYFKDKSKVFNTARVEALEVTNMIEVARATTKSAANRTESRGAHALSDHPERDDENWLRHTLWFSEGSRLEYKPVQMKPLSVESFPPKERTF